MKRTVAMPVSQAREGRKTSALENYLIRFFERELEVKLSRREMNGSGTIWLTGELQLFLLKEAIDNYIEVFHLTKEGENHE